MHQYLHASSCHVYHSKNSIPYGQVLCSYRNCSESWFYYKRCNQSGVWLREQGYSDKLVRQQILKARKSKRNDLLNNMKGKRNDYKLLFSSTYHPNLPNLNIPCYFYTCSFHQTINTKRYFIWFLLLASRK